MKQHTIRTSGRFISYFILTISWETRTADILMKVKVLQDLLGAAALLLLSADEAPQAEISLYRWMWLIKTWESVLQFPTISEWLWTSSRLEENTSACRRLPAQRLKTSWPQGIMGYSRGGSEEQQLERKPRQRRTRRVYDGKSGCRGGGVKPCVCWSALTHISMF